MERTQRVVERLPHFYRAWDSESLLYRFIDAVAKRLSEAQKDLFFAMKAHWLDTAFDGDLDQLGAIFDLPRRPNEADNDYRIRIKNAIHEFKGGGTRDAILASLRVLLGAADAENLELIDNPPARVRVEKRVVSGDSWNLGSMSVEDATAEMEVSVAGGDLRIMNPSITNRDTGESVRFEGELKSGQKLIVRQGSAQLDGLDVSERVSPGTPPKLLKGGSTWSFEEALSAKVGFFDRAVFDESVFAVPLPPTTIRMEWTARQPATFELRVSAGSLARSGLSKEGLEGFVNVIKAAGVKAIVTIKE